MPKTSWIFILFLGLSLAVIVPYYTPTFGAHDFVRYWSSSRLLITGGNPYDAHSLLSLQKQSCPDLHFDAKDIVEAWNPPWLQLILAPLGFLPFPAAVRLWIFLNIFFLATALSITWRMAAGSNLRKYFPIILYAGFLFGNTHEMIKMGQISSLILLALIFGIFLIQKHKDFLSGVFLFFTTIKPHLVFLFFMVIIIWSIHSRRWKIWVGMAAAGLFSSLVITLIYPDWYEIYTEKLYRLPYLAIYNSTLGSFVASLSGINYFRYIGILLLPLAFPLSNRIVEDGWLPTTNLILAVSIPLSFYGFSFDHVLLLPAVTEIIVWIITKKLPMFIAWITAISLIFIYAVLLWMNTILPFPYYWYFLISFGLFLIYFLAWRYRHGRN